ncbi:hypothetical protein EVAR_3200_1 [Eumeta japonica]|uniref:Uncharacterized protein n=1 Tax=Eumeta variegata TaxID=151549 RepID=A0A4C1SXB0_EUMVA|nr:hypothetical protein EVAR_3200_1 [Eumeta japonica]
MIVVEVNPARSASPPSLVTVDHPGSTSLLQIPDDAKGSDGTRTAKQFFAVHQEWVGYVFLRAVSLTVSSELEMKDAVSLIRPVAEFVDGYASVPRTQHKAMRREPATPINLATRSFRRGERFDVSLRGRVHVPITCASDASRS